MKIFLICPVRLATPEDKRKLEDYVDTLEYQGATVHYPARDTNQNDDIGWNICSTNLQAIEEADEVHIWWNKASTGTLFDLGMAFALHKPIVIANPQDVDAVVGKSWENLITYWSWLGDE